MNGWANLSPGGFGFGAMVVTEVLMTGLLVFVVLSTVHRRFAPAVDGLAVGLALTLIHLISIPVDNTSVNPARSLGVAVLAGGDALEQLWAFFVFPLAGAGLGALPGSPWTTPGRSAPELLPRRPHRPARRAEPVGPTPEARRRRTLPPRHAGPLGVRTPMGSLTRTG